MFVMAVVLVHFTGNLPDFQEDCCPVTLISSPDTFGNFEAMLVTLMSIHVARTSSTVSSSQVWKTHAMHDFVAGVANTWKAVSPLYPGARVDLNYLEPDFRPKLVQKQNPMDILSSASWAKLGLHACKCFLYVSAGRSSFHPLPFLGSRFGFCCSASSKTASS